jgi:hypothetical protein
MEPAKVVVRYTSGTLMKGFTQDFSPEKERFHLFPIGQPLNSVEVFMKDLKAVFMVKDFSGDSRYEDLKRFDCKNPQAGKKVEIAFHDGEVIIGSTLAYDRSRPGFFMFPADAHSNNIRVFVVSSAVKDVRGL